MYHNRLEDGGGLCHVDGKAVLLSGLVWASWLRSSWWCADSCSRLEIQTLAIKSDLSRTCPTQAGSSVNFIPSSILFVFVSSVLHSDAAENRQRMRDHHFFSFLARPFLPCLFTLRALSPPSTHPLAIATHLYYNLNFCLLLVAPPVLLSKHRRGSMCQTPTVLSTAGNLLNAPARQNHRALTVVYPVGKQSRSHLLIGSCLRLLLFLRLWPLWLWLGLPRWFGMRALP